MPTFHLTELAGIVALISDDPKHKPLWVDFNSNALTYRRNHGGGRGEALAKAIGLKTYAKPPCVIDATAGWGTDAFLLASLGCRVQMLERDPRMVALLQDGLKRAAADPHTAPIINTRMQLINACALDYLPTLTDTMRPDVIYLDPMFPAPKKQAAPKYALQVLRSLLPLADQTEFLVTAAVRKARRRVVLKRPRHAACQLPFKPVHVYQGQACKYEIYAPVNGSE